MGQGTLCDANFQDLWARHCCPAANYYIHTQANPSLPFMLRLSLSLSLSFLPIQIGVEIPSEVPRGVIKSHLLINSIQLLQIFLLEPEIPRQITPYPFGRLALRQHAVSVRDPPRERDLCAILAVFLADFDDGGVVDWLS